MALRLKSVCVGLFVIFSTVTTGAGVEPEGVNVRLFEIIIEDRQVAGGVKKITVIQGDRVKLRWFSDEEVDVHLHGYDIELKIVANTPTDMTFRAHATGRFPITSHGFGVENKNSKHQHGALLYLEVYPD